MTEELYINSFGKKRPHSENASAESAARMAFFQQVEGLILDKLAIAGITGIELQVVGSVKSGNATESSDIDIRVKISPGVSTEPRQIEARVRQVIQELRKKGYDKYELSIVTSAERLSAMDFLSKKAQAQSLRRALRGQESS